MITTEHHMGWFNSLIVRPPMQPTDALMVVEIVDADDAGRPIKSYEPLGRVDVERLRDLCDEALS